MGKTKRNTESDGFCQQSTLLVQHSHGELSRVIIELIGEGNGGLLLWTTENKRRERN